MDIEKALRQYQKTKDFSDDCQRKKTELFTDFHVLPDDLTIERMVLEEKREIAVFEYNLISAMLDEAALVLERIQKMEDLAESTAK